MTQEKHGYSILNTTTNQIYGELDGKDVFDTKKELIHFIGQEIEQGNLPDSTYSLEIVTIHRDDHKRQKLDELIKQLKQANNENIYITEDIVEHILNREQRE